MISCNISIAYVKHQILFNVIYNFYEKNDIEFNLQKRENTGKHREKYFIGHLIVTAMSSLFVACAA